MARTEHKSFRLTPEPYMRGKRVKPRLRLLAYISCSCAVGVALLSAAGGVLFLATPAGIPMRNSVWGNCLLGIGIPCCMGMLVYFIFKLFCRRFGLMSPEEARDFPFSRRYPDSWLEPAETENERGDY